MHKHECNTGCTHDMTPDTAREAGMALDDARHRLLQESGVTAGDAVQQGVTTGATAGSGMSRSHWIKSLHHHVPVNRDTVLWGYFSHQARPVITIDSNDYVTMETLTHHANDDAQRMVTGDPGALSVFHWDQHGKGVERRGAGAMDAAVGAGGGLGVHICTGPVYVNGAQPGDVLEVRIIDVVPRPSANPSYVGKTFGSNAAANWGFHFGDMLTEPKQREVITIYEIDASGENLWARAVYNFPWTPQTDPFGIVHSRIDYPGVPVDPDTIVRNTGILKNVRIPVRAHFGTIGVAPAEAPMVSSTPPSYTGGNIDNWRIGKGATVYYPVAVPGALFAVGDPHASQGDSELCGTAIECSLTGTFQFILHKQDTLTGTPLEGLHYPLLETRDEWLVHGFSHANYLAELGPDAQHQIFEKSSLELAMRDAYHKMRHFLMTAKRLDEDEAISLMSVAVDFGITQVVDGNWGVHAILKKCIFTA